MPELPEVETVKRQLQKSLIKKKIKAVLVYTHKMIKIGPGKISNIKSGSAAASRKFASLLKNREILGIDRRAKYLIISLSGKYFLMIHLRMSGQLIFIPGKDLQQPLKLSLARTAIAELLPTKHSHVEFTLTNSKTRSVPAKLFYNDTRQFGHIRLVSKKELAEVLEIQNLGPEPLDMNFTKFKEIILSHSKKRAKDFLLNQNIIAGIGNIYADESLFMAKIHPLRKIGSLNPRKKEKLFIAIQKVLKKAIQSGGSSIEYFLMTNGSAGKFSQQHQVYGKKGEPCPVCGRPLKSQKIGSRTSTFCTYCQK